MQSKKNPYPLLMGIPIRRAALEDSMEKCTQFIIDSAIPVHRY